MLQEKTPSKEKATLQYTIHTEGSYSLLFLCVGVAQSFRFDLLAEDSRAEEASDIGEGRHTQKTMKYIV